ncbi:MAG: 16S rRNA (cytosine(1402)-N(4))-methyltransferase RsmH [Gammaproteobacteria bacterium]|nr:16S rRNA (cytosine(1402)-N(4))-methyltransferase RsmH [Gammaproteobacteria bacterium]MCW8840073.1 16S rRNA (cytosine(1402)-N(4))-methyltransferase RsmH [Gammaproteobacteria bacterium]MCW8927961.1 16S rRNA (cytosine(1402)-N(4))-methyltransferase RsmH [Gammaproteobacteria bacterium]MCW8959725.1 16S rRNA (cytosine(1402)-N(4))-methyltransferase RsmH [Gammaproteobacteria bacterium]MCW8971922.1 16S rRNA (cytosine(1402)-N(4))-methyltransferase RsmH [Gammaproteobacteria bacterium]
MEHRPVLLDEVLEALAIRPDGIYLDGTFGRGGHSAAILQELNENGRLLAVDKDPQAIAVAKQRFGGDSRFSIVRGSFTMLGQEVESRGWKGRVDGILLDLGVSSPQLDDAQRGFSFRHDGPLDMRMDPDSGISAAEWLNSAKEAEIAQVLKEYGEERFAKRIARAIVQQRELAPIITTARLAKIVAEANPKWERDKNPATRTFQAIRIFINSELDELELVLNQSVAMLAPGGRLAVISFHSLEDRRVKRFIRDEARGGDFPPDLPLTDIQLNRRLRAVGKDIRANQQELAVNPRARSAVLRVAERLG